MQRQAAAKIDRQIGGTDAEIPQAEERVRVDTTQPEIEPYKPKVRKSGTGCVTMINDHLFEVGIVQEMPTVSGKRITSMPRRGKNAKKS